MGRKPPTSKFGRLARLGGLTTRVTASYLGQRISGAFQSEEAETVSRNKAHIDNAERVVDTVGMLKGAAMKVGQTVAMLAEGAELPPEVARVLGKLHDSAAPVPFETIKAEVERELDGKLEDLFDRFEPNSLGSASLGQAHAAWLKDGTPVVVKVLHVGIEDSVDSDLSALKTLLRASRFIKRDKAEMDAVFAEIRDRLREELDYYHEAANLEYFHRYFMGVDGVRVPSHYPSHSTGKVLTMERLYGVNLEEFLENSTHEARQKAAMGLVVAFHEMTYKARALHSDPHPGNYLFEPDGTVGILDFGCVKRFDPYFMANYARIGSAAVNNDRERTLEFARELGTLRGDSPEAEDLHWELCDIMATPFRGGVYRCGVSEDALQNKLQKLAPKFVKFPEIQAPADLVYLNRALAGVYHIARKLRFEADLGEMFFQYAEHAIGIAEGRIQE